MIFLLGIFVCLALTELSTESNSTNFQVSSQFPKKTCKKKSRSFKAIDIPNSITCGSICASNSGCKSLFFFPTTLRCDGCELTYVSDEDLVTVGDETVHYTTEIAEPLPIREGYKLSGCYPKECGLLKCRRLEIDMLNTTEEECLEFCGDFSASSTTFALQGGTCYCGWNYNTLVESTCDTPCPGNPKQTCGGTDAVTMFSID